jgi:hypothetical protein
MPSRGSSARACEYPLVLGWRDVSVYEFMWDNNDAFVT